MAWYRSRLPNLASQMRLPLFSSMDWNTSPFAWRTGDDFQHLGGRGLLLQQLDRSSVRWRSSFSSRVFSIAITACAAKFGTSSICLSVNGRTSWRKMVIAPIVRLP